MSTSYSDYGTALFDFMEAIDITSVEAEGWAHTFNRPPKSDEMDDYPCFAVVPTRDEQETMDSRYDSDSITYSVFIFVRYWDAGVPESQIRQLVDLVRTALRKERGEISPLGGSYALTFTGEWGGDENQVERFYRLDVTARFTEDTD